MSDPVKYNDVLVSEIANRIFCKAMLQAERLIDVETYNPEKVIALAQLADAAASGFMDNDEDDNDED